MARFCDERSSQGLTLPQLHIPRPCDRSWEAMAGDDRRRFCETCGQHVHDLSAMGPRQVRRLLRRAMRDSGRLPCVQVRCDADGRLVTRNRVAAWRRRAGAVRWGLVVVLSGCVCGWLVLLGVLTGRGWDTTAWGQARIAQWLKLGGGDATRSVDDAQPTETVVPVMGGAFGLGGDAGTLRGKMQIRIGEPQAVLGTPEVLEVSELEE